MENVLNFVYFFFIAFTVYRIIYGIFFKSFYKVDADESNEMMSMEFTDEEIQNAGKNKLIYFSSHFRMLFLEKGAFVASLIGLFSQEYSNLFAVYASVCAILWVIVMFKSKLYRSMEFAFDTIYYLVTTCIAIVFTVSYIMFLLES